VIVRELIGGPVDTCTSDLDLATAAREMLSADVGSLAVMRDNELIGIVTERDLLKVVADGRSPRKTTVDDVMTPAPDSLGPEVEIEDAADWMMAAGYRHLPIVDSGQLIGIISIKDVLWALTEQRVEPGEPR